MTEDRWQRTEDRGQTIEVGSRNAEFGIRNAECGSGNFEVGSHKNQLFVICYRLLAGEKCESGRQDKWEGVKVGKTKFEFAQFRIRITL